MSHMMVTRAVRAAVLAAIFPALALAQGRITGTVTTVSNQPIANAQVLVSGASLSGESGPDGKYTIRNVPAGTYVVRVVRLGYKAQAQSITLGEGRDATAFFIMEEAPSQIGGVVVSASRRVEKITDAPATVTRLEEIQIANTLGNSFAPALRDVKGLEFIQTGVMSSAVNARGFNSSFNNRMLMMEDGRIAVLAESGLPVGSLTTIPKIDLAGVEVLVGPGSALYGPDASNGVITLQTKDPMRYPTSSFEVSGGTRNFYDGQARLAGAHGRWGYKASGEYEAADEFSNQVYYPGLTAGAAAIPEKGANWRSDATRGSGTLAYYLDGGGRLNATAGISKINGIGQTNVGRNQLVNYGYRDYQLQYAGARWFAQTYMTNSVSGTTYQLNGFSQNSVRYPTLNPDSVKSLSAFPGDGRVQAAEVQNNFSIGMLAHTGISAIDNTHFILGVQGRRDRVSSYMHWLSDRNTHEAIKIEQKGVYGQMETPLSEMFRIVLAGRYDKHDKYDGQFSPKAGLLFSPVQDQTLRVTFNRAFKSPSVLQTDFFYPNFQPFIGVFGNEDGFDVKNAGGTIVNAIAPIKPEVNNTWEVGYKGVAANRLYVDVAGYRSNFKDFLSPLVVIANPLTATPTTAYNHATGAKVTDPNGGPQVVLTYFNVGEATITGVDAGLRFYFTDKIAASGNASLIKVDTIKRKTGDPVEATAFNTSSARLTAGMDFTDLVKNTIASFTTRYVNRYDFRSGINYGTIPSFATFDLSASYKLGNSGAKILLQAQNLFACAGGTSTPPAAGVSSAVPAAYTTDRKCGFGQLHQEMLNMPAVGPIILVGVHVDQR